MRRSLKTLILVVLLFSSNFPATTSAQAGKPDTHKKGSLAASKMLLWHEPEDIRTRDLYYGAGGKEDLPQGKLKFLSEDHNGSSPKFEVEDEQGTKWKIKLGPEAQSETAATRLVWAAGYFTDEDYYFPELRVEGMKPLKRGQHFISADGLVRGARLERHLKGEKKVGTWKWDDNPFAKTKELDGLKVLMALINNWDLKTENNGIYQGKDGSCRYLISDLGASFGKTGNSFTRTRNDLKGYLESKFIKKAKPQKVDFVLHSRPFFLLFFDLPYYHQRTHMEKLVKDIPRSHAKWMGDLLAQLSEQQISDAFRAAGYTPQEVSAFTRKVRERIAELNEL